MTQGDRESRPVRTRIETDPKKRARIEAANGLRQAEAVIETILDALRDPTAFRLRPSLINRMNRLAVEGLTEYAGIPRPHGMGIHGSRHEPPPPDRVQELVEEFCDYINENWSKPPLHLAAYAMWRLNWIHPFDDGNGRTARAVAYIVLSIRLKTLLPGRATVVEQIIGKKGPYYRALEAADQAIQAGRIDVSKMEELLSTLLAKQFTTLHREARGES
jgi:Fic family protein